MYQTINIKGTLCRNYIPHTKIPMNTELSALTIPEEPFPIIKHQDKTSLLLWTLEVFPASRHFGLILHYINTFLTQSDSMINTVSKLASTLSLNHICHNVCFHLSVTVVWKISPLGATLIAWMVHLPCYTRPQSPSAAPSFFIIHKCNFVQFTHLSEP